MIGRQRPRPPHPAHGPDRAHRRARAAAHGGGGDALGLDCDRPAAALNLGADNINDIGTTAGRIVATLRAAGDMQLVIVRSPISIGSGDLAPADNVQVRSVYSVSRYLCAFDVAFFAAGDKLVSRAAGVRRPDRVHAQRARDRRRSGGAGRFAEWAGAALAVSGWSTGDLIGRVNAVLDPQLRAHLVSRCRAMVRATARRTPRRWPGSRRGTGCRHLGTSDDDDGNG